MVIKVVLNHEHRTAGPTNVQLAASALRLTTSYHPSTLGPTEPEEAYSMCICAPDCELKRRIQAILKCSCSGAGVALFTCAAIPAVA